MADEPLSRVGKGDPITADWANAVADAINARGASDPNANGTATPYGTMTPADVDTQMRAPDAQAMPFDAAIIRDGGDDEIWMAIPGGVDLVRLGSTPVPSLPEQTRGTAQNAWIKIADVTNGAERFAFLALGYPEDPNATQTLGWRVFVDSSQNPENWPAWVDTSRPALLLASWNIAADDTSGTDTAAGDVPSLRKGLVQHHRGAATFGGGSAGTPFLTVRITDDYVYVYMGPDGGAASVRVNGETAAIAYTAANLGVDGWLKVGSSEGVVAVWLVPTSLPYSSGMQTYYDATTGAVGYSFDLTGTRGAPGAQPANVPNNDWPRWMHPIEIAWLDEDGETLVQGVTGGMDVSIEVGDADGTHSGYSTPGPGVAGGFCSVEQNDKKQTQLYGFQNPNLVTPTSAMVQAAGIDLVIRQAAYSGQGAASITMARVRYMQLYELLDVLRTIVGDDWWTTFQNQLPAIMDLLDDYSEQNNGPFWRSGGDSGTCYGEDIADSNGTKVIDLDACELIGAWIVRTGAGSFTVDGDLDTTGSASVGADLSVAGTASVNGSLSAGNDITSGGDVLATGKISGSSLEVNGDTYVPQQITYLDGNGVAQTITVLKKQ